MEKMVADGAVAPDPFVSTKWKIKLTEKGLSYKIELLTEQRHELYHDVCTSVSAVENMVSLTSFQC